MSTDNKGNINKISKKAEHLRRCIGNGQINLREIEELLAEVGSMSAPLPQAKPKANRKEHYKALIYGKPLRRMAN